MSGLSPRGQALFDGFQKVAPGAADYFRPWTFDVPLAIRKETSDRLRRVQQLYLKCIRRFAEHYDRYRDLMPVPDRVTEILALCRRKPYRPGTYRTDFVIDESNRARLIETTCRFAMNGYFTSGFFVHNLADRWLAGRPAIRKIDEYTAFYERYMDSFGPFDHVCLLKGADERNDTKFVIPVFEAAGFPVRIIRTAEVPARAGEFAGAAVLGELSHEELCGLPTETIKAIIDADSMNDLRTVFLFHDKRFFALLYHDAFAREALTAAELDELRACVVPTYTKRLNPELWPRARDDKDRWIIKPHNMGKSIDVHAGCVTDPAEWRALFDSGRADRMVLQEYVPQRRFRGTIGDKACHDYVVGTLLFFEDGYFGPGLCRASSFPVTNKVDDRKVAPLVTDDLSAFEADNVI
ncbi:MAG TPA: hypothetical protein PK634_10655 [Kiritimatiellia bacterium]|nr:hypothetical protein [Kiritimatiellia bacterium]